MSSDKFVIEGEEREISPVSTGEPEQQHHYFANTAFNWATGNTRAEALAKLAKVTKDYVGDDAFARNGGLYCASWKVLAPQSASYKISFYTPIGVKLEDPLECKIVSADGHVVVVD